nr:hypothetical protein [Tanacetum cinerariifolium]
LLHLAGSQPMLKSSYKAKASVIISIPPLVGGVADVVIEIKGWSISITFRFSVGLQTPDDLSRSRLGFIEKIGVKGKQEKDKIETKPDKNGKRGKAGKSQKQLQSREQEKQKKMQVEGPKMQTPTELLKKEERKGQIFNYFKVYREGAVLPTF